MLVIMNIDRSSDKKPISASSISKPVKNCSNGMIIDKSRGKFNAYQKMHEYDKKKK